MKKIKKLSSIFNKKIKCWKLTHILFQIKHDLFQPKSRPEVTNGYSNIRLDHHDYDVHSLICSRRPSIITFLVSVFYKFFDHCN